MGGIAKSLVEVQADNMDCSSLIHPGSFAIVEGSQVGKQDLPSVNPCLLLLSPFLSASSLSTCGHILSGSMELQMPGLTRSSPTVSSMTTGNSSLHLWFSLDLGLRLLRAGPVSEA